jgi:hypothetical protein
MVFGKNLWAFSGSVKVEDHQKVFERFIVKYIMK